ncbi:MAG: CotH kinase family protein [Flavobacteriales bacterium]|nr:CotH kinase family protein [Flavobacteriales bacterium]
MSTWQGLRATMGSLLILLLAFVLVAWIGGAPPRVQVVPGGVVPDLGDDQAHRTPGGLLKLEAGSNGRGYFAIGPDGEFTPFNGSVDIELEPSKVQAARLLATPISLTWRHPFAGLPAARSVRIANAQGDGRTEERLRTFLFADHGELPVVSLQMPMGALLDPDTGLLVVGNAIFHGPKKMLIAEARDPRWWKYPGNFHMRGREWERAGRMQFILPDGGTGFETAVRVRINGQMTRGFPQHAFRLGFREPLRYDLFGEEVKEGYDALVLRAAGNDQIKAMMRDVFQHRLCEGLPFETSGHRTCVVYINDAYWGVHHLRPRMDDEEVARRYGIPRKRITILEDEARLYRGDTAEVARFERLANLTGAWDGRDAAWADTLLARVDVEGFLSYMATQMILGNMDWPNQNVRFWRYSGKPRKERPLDGRWYFIMGDSDLGYGVQGPPSADMFLRAKVMDVPITRLFWGMMRWPPFKARFIEVAEGLLQGPFSTERSLRELDAIVLLMAPEMERHTARWRKPANVDDWRAFVDVMRNFAQQRGPAVRDQLRAFAAREVDGQKP